MLMSTNVGYSLVPF